MGDLWSGLIGALVGGVLAAGATVWVEQKRNARSKQAEQEKESRALRGALRAVLADLTNLHRGLRASANWGTWWGEPHRQPSSEVVAILATGLQEDEWWELARALGAFVNAENVRRGALDPARPNADDVRFLYYIAQEVAETADKLGEAYFPAEWDRFTQSMGAKETPSEEASPDTGDEQSDSSSE